MQIRQLVYRFRLIALPAFLIYYLSMPCFPALADDFTVTPVYVGSEVCRNCHEEEYSSFTTYAKKNRSFESIERLRTRLFPEEIKKCYSCHTTGYGQPGGFTSLEETPHLKNAGCEVCHGPGSIHVQTKTAGDIKRYMTKKDCEVCHISERVKAFRYKPLIHGGAH
ncbi:multiheme c-type cytochrome [Thermodesulfobacteriota bacterium]